MAARVPLIPLSAVLGTQPVYTVQHVAGRNWSFYEHSHRGFGELICIVAGEVRHRTAGQETVLGAGSLVFIREHDRHALESTNLRLINLIIPSREWLRLAAFLDEPGLTRRLDRLRNAPQVQLDVGQCARCCADLEVLFRTQGDSIGARQRLTRFLLTWLPCFGDAGEGEADPRAAWLRPLLAEIEDRLETGIAVADLPRRAGVSAAHLARTFRRHLACTPSAWLTRCRIERAAVLLTRSERDIDAIRSGLGFASRAWFHNRFRAIYGETPARYRLRHARPVAGREAGQ